MWTLMLAGTVGFWVVVALAIRTLLTDRQPYVVQPEVPGARQLLDLRLARGEIDATEYGRARDLIEHG
jgi:putative membrane protein